MTTLTGRPRTALLVVDMQNGVVAQAYERDRVVANVATLVDRARSEGVPVVWVQDDDAGEQGSEEWRLVDPLAVREPEAAVRKRYADAFEDTELEAVLAGQEVGRLVVCGAQTDECIRSTLHGALVRGYDVLLVDDAHTTEDLSAYGAPTPDLVIAHTNLYWSDHRAPGRTAGVVSTSDPGLSPAAGESGPSA
jgi:nicotinamidase-related amidase